VPSQVPNATDRSLPPEGAVRLPLVGVVEPVWQRPLAVGVLVFTPPRPHSRAVVW